MLFRYGLVDSDEEDAAPGEAGAPDDQEPADMGDEGGEPEGEGMLLSTTLRPSDILYSNSCIATAASCQSVSQ